MRDEPEDVLDGPTRVEVDGGPLGVAEWVDVLEGRRVGGRVRVGLVVLEDGPDGVALGDDGRDDFVVGDALEVEDEPGAEVDEEADDVDVDRGVPVAVADGGIVRRVGLPG